jgi:hypothetical protein
VAPELGEAVEDEVECERELGVVVAWPERAGVGDGRAISTAWG